MLKLSRHECHSLVVLLEEKIDRFIQLSTEQSLKSSSQLSHLRSKLLQEQEKITKGQKQIATINE
jgi:hypothetical protein